MAQIGSLEFQASCSLNDTRHIGPAELCHDMMVRCNGRGTFVVINDIFLPVHDVTREHGCEEHRRVT